MSLELQQGSVSELEDRSSFIVKLFETELGLQVRTRSVYPVRGFTRDSQVEVGADLKGFNTFVHVVHVKGRVPDHVPRPQSPGAVRLLDPVPAQLVVRIPNPRTQDDPRIKMENEVAALALVRSSTPTSVLPVPDIYAWSGEGWGWMVMELLPGAKWPLPIS